MAERLHIRPVRRTAIALIVLVSVLGAPAAAGADGPFVACWVEEEDIHPITLKVTYVTVCRLAGGEVAEYEGESPPGPVHPEVGSDATGVCWYYTSAVTDWEVLSVLGDGWVILGMRVNGFLALDTGPVPRCTSEPVTVDPPPLLAWEAVTEYVHDPPEPVLNPQVGWGLAGLDTHVGAAVPGLWSDTITVPGSTIDVEVWVEAFFVDWGDGVIDRFGPAAYPRLVGYPEGLAWHMYEAKTCVPADAASDCYPGLEAYPLTIGYDWAARWRVNGSGWITLDVPAGETTVAYPVTEIVSTLIETG